MEICVKSKFLRVVILTLFVYCCSSNDLSTPEKTMESLYYAISKKDAGLYAKCFHEQGQFTTNEIKLGARYIFTHFKILKYKITQKENVSPNEVRFTMEEVLQKDNGLKFMSTSIVTYIKVGKEWKILSTKDIESKKIE